MNLTGLLNSKISLTDEDLKVTDETHVLIANSLKIFIEEFVVKVATSLVIVCSSRSQSSLYHIQNIIQVLLSIIMNISVQLIFIDYKNPLPSRSYGLYNLVLVDSFEAFR